MSRKLVRLSDVAEINPRFRPEDMCGEITVSFVPMAAVSEVSGAIVQEVDKPIAEVIKGFTPFLNGDILIAKITPCFENGKIALAQLSRRVGFGSTEFHVVRPIANKLDARYVFHFLRQPRIRKDGEGRMTGSAGQRRVPKNYIEHLEIPLPPLTEQKHIASILDEADTLRRKRRESLAKLDTLLQSVFLEMFGDPVTNPKGWKTVRLGDIGKLDRGKSKHRPRNAPELYGGVYPFIQTGDVANTNHYITGYRQTYSDLGLKQSKIWPQRTLCITIAANIALTAILKIDACFPDSVVGFVPNNRTRVEYVHVWFSFMQEYLESIAPESAQKNINLEILRELLIQEPPIDLQDKFVDAFNELILLRTKMCAEQEKEEMLFHSLQHRAFSPGDGALDLPHAPNSIPNTQSLPIQPCLTLDF